jgi:hypothetical protein
MENKKTRNVFNVLYLVSAISVLAGAFLMLIDNDLSHIVLVAGALVGIWTLIIENSLLKKRISQLEKDIRQ